MKIFKYPIIGPYTPLRTPRRTCQYLSGPEILEVRNYLPQYSTRRKYHLLDHAEQVKLGADGETKDSPFLIIHFYITRASNDLVIFARTRCQRALCCSRVSPTCGEFCACGSSSLPRLTCKSIYYSRCVRTLYILFSIL